MFMRLTELTFDQTGVQVRQKQQQAKRTKHVQPAHSGRHARNGGRPSAAHSHNHVQAQLQPQPQMQQQTAQQQVLLQLQQHQQQAPMHSHPNLPQGSLQVGSPGAAPAIDFIAWNFHVALHPCSRDAAAGVKQTRPILVPYLQHVPAQCCILHVVIKYENTSQWVFRFAQQELVQVLLVSLMMICRLLHLWAFYRNLAHVQSPDVNCETGTHHSSMTTHF